MDRFRSLEIFAKTAEHLNFAAAARDLKMTRAMVSKHIGELETHLGVRLFQRTTRRVGLTEAGRALASKADGVIETLKEAEDAVRDLHTVLRGRLRINAPVSFGVQHLGPLVTRFLRDHPGVEVELTLNDRTVDLIEEGYDLVIRIGTLTDSSLIARRLAPARLIVVGSREYLQLNGMPKQPADLKRHNCLGYTYWSLRDEWPIANANGVEERVKVKGSLTANNGDALRAAAIDGLGLILQPSFSVGADIASGRLVHVLPDCKPRELSVYAVYAPGHPPTAKLRAFIDMLARAWGDAPPWDSWIKRR